MTRTAIRAEKRAAYQTALYRVAPGFSLIPGTHSPELAALYAQTRTNSALLITAHNPQGTLREAAANQAAQTSLATRLNLLTRHLWPAENRDPQALWPPEPSFLALGITRKRSRALAQEFAQDAILWAGAAAIPKLIWLR